MRYIDADALIKKIYPMGIGDGKYTINAKAVKLAIDNAPTADVVPKSEVERWRRNLEAVLEERAEEKSEVAREIFEEIEKLMFGIIVQGNKRVFFDNKKFAELKKKYTEG